LIPAGFKKEEAEGSLRYRLIQWVFSEAASE
jgi:hypothetical protein